MARRLALATALLAAVVAATADPASACSCALGDPRRALMRSDAAFVGALVEKRTRPSGPISSSADPATYVFRVFETVKGRLPRTVEVEAPESGASCGIETPVGLAVGLFLSRRGDTWTSSLCAQIAPAELRRAARPLPRPDGEGPAALLAGGSFGDVRLLALDRRGRTLHYGRGLGTTGALSVCPGRRRVVELVHDYPRVSVAVRSLPRLELVRELRIPARMLDDRAGTPTNVSCRSRDGHAALVFAGGEIASLLVRLHDGVFTVVHRGRAREAVFAGGVAWLVSGQHGTELLRLDLRTMRTSRVASLPAGTSMLTAAPGARRFAAVAWGAPTLGTQPVPRRVVVDARGRARVRTTPFARTSSVGSIVWLDARRVAFLPAGDGRERTRVYDVRLRLLAHFQGWSAQSPVLLGDAVLGLTWRGELVSARLPSGPARVVRRLPSPEVRALVALR
jgi:hypothetical protein